MKKWRLIAGIGLIFALGLLFGSIGTRLYDDYRVEHAWRDAAARKASFLRKLTRELRLDKDQQGEFRTIIEELDRRREALSAERRAEIRKMVDEAFSRMKGRLSPAQQQRLDELRARHEERIKKRRGPARGLF